MWLQDSGGGATFIFEMPMAKFSIEQVQPQQSASGGEEATPLGWKPQVVAWQ